MDTKGTLMSTYADLGRCPDCQQDYKDPETILPPASEIVESEPMTRGEWAAELHRDIECPAQKERDRVESLERVLRYYGIADTLAKLGDIIRVNEHDSEIIWGDPERWLKREQGQPVCCPNCAAPLGKIEGGRLRMGAVILDPEDEGTDDITCVACEKSFALKTALANVAQGKQPQPRSLTLVRDEKASESGSIINDLFQDRGEG